MTESAIAESAAKAMNPETFDVLDYLENGDIAQDTVSIYTHKQSARDLAELVAQREAEIANRREAERRLAAKGGEQILGLDEAPAGDDEDTEYDDAINELVAKLEETKLVFHMKSVSPVLTRAINKSYDAKKKEAKAEKPEWSAEDEAKYEDTRTFDILSRCIDYVSRGDGSEDRTPYDGTRLSKLEERLYKEQKDRLLNALYDMIYLGSYFDQALTADFS